MLHVKDELKTGSLNSIQRETEPKIKTDKVRILIYQQHSSGAVMPE